MDKEYNRHRMTNFRELGFLLFVLVGTAYSEAPEVPETIFRPEGGDIKMGYCFGVDYITVLRSAPEGEQLIGNFSDEVASPSPPADFEGRVRLTNQLQLLGLQISQLRQSDSGVYRRECWKDKALVSKHEHKLSVCFEEISSVDISVQPNGGAELKCNITATSLEGKTIRWYHEVFPNYKATCFLDTSVSSVPLQEELRGVIAVKKGGISLNVSGSVLKDSHNFYCLVMDGQRCLSFQMIYNPKNYEIDPKTVFTSVGEKVVLTCPSEEKSHDQRWEAPMGNVNSKSVKSAILFSDDNDDDDDDDDEDDYDDENFSLIVHVLSANYSGEYKCFSASLLVAEYALVLCPSGEPTERQFSDGEDVVLECAQGREESHRGAMVEWYRRKPLEEEHLILDSNNKTIVIPADLRGRVVFSEQDSSLQLSDLIEGDRGEYWCVVLGSPDYIDDDNYTGDDDDDDDDEYPEGNDDDGKKDSIWQDYKDYMETCISKQVTSLTPKEKPEDKNRGINTDFTPPKKRDPDTKTPVEEDTDNTIVIAVCGALAGLLIVAVIAAVVVVRRRRAANTERGAAMGSGLKTMGTGLSEEEKLDPDGQGP